jgi:hypothetical protein
VRQDRVIGRLGGREVIRALTCSQHRVGFGLTTGAAVVCVRRVVSYARSG